MANIVLKNALLADGLGTFIPDGILVVSGERIEALGSAEQFAGRDFAGYEVIDVGGRLTMPGFLVGHHHLYSALATGLAPAGPTENFVQILENLWWRLDRVLDEESVYYSVLMGIVDAVRHGATAIFDHHASMNFVRGSLDVIAGVFSLAGVRGLLCFETSDRSGKDKIEEHIRENIDFYEKHRNSPGIRGAFGLHANFTLSDDTLRAVAESKPAQMPIHIHCGEDAHDLNFCRQLGYSGPVERLARFGLLDGNSILAHCIHLDEADYDIIRQVKPIVAANFESNANNRVGRMNRRRIGRYILGTDGITADMILTLRSAYFLNAADGITFEELADSFFAYRREVQERFFPDTASLDVGKYADIAVLDYVPATQLTPENLAGHLIFGVKSARAFITIGNGEILFRDGEVKFCDEEKVRQKAKDVSRKLWERFYTG